MAPLGFCVTLIVGSIMIGLLVRSVVHGKSYETIQSDHRILEYRLNEIEAKLDAMDKKLPGR